MPKDNNTFFVRKNVWSEVKDALLGCYFKPYVSKILYTRRPLFYVDCFAGKGKFDDGKKGSPLIALDIIDECQRVSSIQNPQIQSCFIELNHAEELSKNITAYGNIQVISGKYEDNIETLLQGKQKQNVFLYVDPYGIKALNCGLFDKFSGNGFNSIELLINMNSFGFIREACRALDVTYSDVEAFDEIVEYEPSIMDSSAQSIQELTDIAGGEYWKKIVEDYKEKRINGYEAEIRFSLQYCQRLNQNYKYVLNMPIRLREGQRPKYRMIHATNHEDGCVLMYDNICKRWEALSHIQTDGQLKLFEETIENTTIDMNDIKTRFAAHVAQYTTDTKLNKFLAEFYANNGVLCPSGDIRKILPELEKTGAIIVSRTPATTKTGAPSKFFTQSASKSIFIRRKP